VRRSGAASRAAVAVVRSRAVSSRQAADRPRSPRDEERVLAEPTDHPAADRPRARPRTRLLLALAAVVLLVDLATKVLVVATIGAGEDIRVLGGLLYLTQLRNVGAAFSFAEGATVLFSMIAVVVAVVIVRSARRMFSTGWAVSLGLVLGGAVGNLIDRIFRDPGFLRGGVVDFLSVFAPDGRIWPVFNVADSAIVCGGVLGAFLALRGIEFDGTRARSGGAAGAAAGDGGTARG
jgi:signal peptidase II